jgi:hypothetical protein
MRIANRMLNSLTDAPEVSFDGPPTPLRNGAHDVLPVSAAGPAAPHARGKLLAVLLDHDVELDLTS